MSPGLSVRRGWSRADSLQRCGQQQTRVRVGVTVTLPRRHCALRPLSFQLLPTPFPVLRAQAWALLSQVFPFHSG